MRWIFKKAAPSTFYILVLFSSKHPILEGFLVKETPPNHVKYILAKKEESFVENTINI